MNNENRSLAELVREANERLDELEGHIERLKEYCDRIEERLSIEM
ncbi:hypothetical protein [Sporolactobacillus shoreae]|nr:hypothetical protein [Sporolactobacillus shoreae]